jgi:hypothetical protein
VNVQGRTDAEEADADEESSQVRILLPGRRVREPGNCVKGHVMNLKRDLRSRGSILNVAAVPYRWSRTSALSYKLQHDTVGSSKTCAIPLRPLALTSQPLAPIAKTKNALNMVHPSLSMPSSSSPSKIHCHLCHIYIYGPPSTQPHCHKAGISADARSK